MAMIISICYVFSKKGSGENQNSLNINVAYFLSPFTKGKFPGLAFKIFSFIPSERSNMQYIICSLRLYSKRYPCRTHTRWRARATRHLTSLSTHAHTRALADCKMAAFIFDRNEHLILSSLNLNSATACVILKCQFIF